MNKIIYLANVRMPTEKAHGIQIVKMCEALAGQGLAVELVVPDRFNPIKNDVFDYYEIETNFILSKLPCIDLISCAVRLGPLGYWAEALSFAWSVKKYLKNHSNLTYTRELSNVAFLGSGSKIVFEAHNLPQKTNPLYLHWLKKAEGLVVITHGLKDNFIALGFPAERILVAPDAVDLKMFNIGDSQIDCRKQLNLPLDKKVLLYTGHLYDWKGAGTVLAAAELLPECLVVFVGGTDVDVVDFKREAQNKRAKNVLIIGHRPVGEIPTYLCAADILVLPNSATPTISARYTSPLKLFEYLASRRPIVVSDLPSLREILDEEIATFFAPDNPQSLVDSIRWMLNNPAEIASKTEKAYLKVQEYTWDKRAKKIFEFINLSFDI